MKENDSADDVEKGLWLSETHRWGKSNVTDECLWELRGNKCQPRSAAVQFSQTWSMTKEWILFLFEGADNDIKLIQKLRCDNMLET